MCNDTVKALWTLRRKALVKQAQVQDVEGPASLRALGWYIDAQNCLVAIQIMTNPHEMAIDKAAIRRAACG